MRVCVLCELNKPLDAFPVSRGSKGGHEKQCRECKCEYVRLKVRGYRRCRECKEVSSVEDFQRVGRIRSALCLRCLPVGRKVCSGCCEKKSCSEFSVSLAAADGLQLKCKTCCRSWQSVNRPPKGRKKVSAEEKKDTAKRYRSSCQIGHSRGTLTVVEEKRCSKCGIIKIATEFFKNNSVKSGLSSGCRACKYKYERKRRTEDPEYREKMKDFSREYYYRNREKTVERTRERAALYREKNRERLREYGKRYYRRNREKHLARWHNYDAKKRCNGGSHTHEQWRVMCEFWDDSCLRCGGSDLVRDHVVPVSKGGPNGIANLQPLCVSCNLKKSATVADYRDPAMLTELMWQMELHGFL